jgi:HEAT repeat protein
MRVLSALLSLAVLLPCAPLAGQDYADSRILAAARAADRVWQQRLTVLYQDLASADTAVRTAAMAQLADLGDPAAAPRIAANLDPALRGPDELIAGVTALANLKARGQVESMRRLTAHPDERVRLAALNAIDRLGSPDDWRPRTGDDGDTIRRNAIANEATLGPAESAAVLVQGLKGERDPVTRRLCAYGLARLGDRANGPALTEALTDPDPGVRRTAAEALVAINYTPAIPYLIRALEAGAADTYLAAALDRLAKHRFGYDPRATIIQRQAVIDAADVWWGEHAAELGK